MTDQATLIQRSAAQHQGRLLFSRKTGEPVRPDSLRMHLGRARLTRTSLEANGSICRGMLKHRYDSTTGVGQLPEGEKEDQ